MVFSIKDQNLSTMRDIDKETNTEMMERAFDVNTTGPARD